MKLTTANLKSRMKQLSHDGDQESYSELWKAINVLWNLGLLEEKYNAAMVAEDHRLFESGEAAPICDGTFNLNDYDI